jgi:hypothetical protein
MAVTRTLYMSNTREMMDAVGSSRWSDTYIKTILGQVGGSEWQGILGANPTYRFNQITLTTASDGTFPYSSLSTGSGNTAKNLYRILAITDGAAVVYRQTDFMSMPLASLSGQAVSAPYPLAYQWYDAGTNAQILPVGAVSLQVTVNYTPTAMDSLAADSDTYDFPAGHEAIVWLMAAAFLLEKGGAEAEAANVLRASADARRQAMFAQIGRRAARPMSLAFDDSPAAWGG